MQNVATNSEGQSGGINRLRLIFHWLFAAFAAVGAIWIFALMVLIVADVVGRNILDLPIIGVSEIAARSVGAILFLLLPFAAIHGKLIQADFLVRYLASRQPIFVNALETLFSVVGVLMFFAIAYASWPDMMSALASSEFFGVQGVWTLPVFPFKVLLVGGAISTAIGFLFAAIAPWQSLDMMNQNHE